MHADHILFVFVITVRGVCVHNTHACPNDTTTEPVSSGEPPTNGSKTCICPDGMTKGIDCKLKIRRMNARIICVKELKTKKVIKFIAKHCNPKGEEEVESLPVKVEKLDIVWPRDQFLLFSKQCWISHSYELLDDAGKPLQWEMKLHGNLRVFE